MRIAFLLPDPGIPVGGTKGASVHVREVCTALARRGHEVLLCAHRVTGPVPDGVEVVSFDRGPLPRAEGADVARLGAARDFATRSAPVLRAFGPDLVYERLSLMSAGAAGLAAELRAARLLEVNAPIVDEWARHHPLSLVDTAVEQQRMALAGAQVVAVSAPLAQWALDHGAARAAVLPNGVDVQRFRPPAGGADARQRRALRARLGLEGADVIGFVGSLKPWHGVDVLVAAMARVAPAQPNARLLVVGDGPQRGALRDQVERLGLQARVIFTGAVPAEAVPGYVAALDVATAPFLPSADFYFSPLKVAEAMAGGRAVVASRIGPIEVMTAEAAVLVRPGDVGALAGGLTALLDDPARREALGARARRRAVTQLSWDGVVERSLALIAPRGANDQAVSA